MLLTELEIAMSEAVEGGAAIAWRLLATLEGGSLILATTALLAYTARSRVVKKRSRRLVNSVLISNTTSPLGTELKRQLESHGCIVSTVTVATNRVEPTDAKVDALVIVGATPRDGLDGLGELVSEDVYRNLSVLDKLAPRVHRGGCITWACAGVTRGSFSVAATAFDAALQASLQHVAKSFDCEPIWVGRCEDVERAAERIVAALAPGTTQCSRFSVRNAAYKVSGYIGRWLKIVT